MKVAALFSHPIQYFAPLFRHLTSEHELDLTVLFSSPQGLTEYIDKDFNTAIAWDIPLLDGYRSTFLSNASEQADSRQSDHRNVIRELSRGDFDTVWVHGYMSATNWLAIAYAQWKQLPILLSGDANLLNPRPLFTRAIKRAILSLLFRRIAAFLYIGTLNRDFYRHYGVPDRKLFLSPYAVDNAFFQEQCAKWKALGRERQPRFLRQRPAPVILFVGKLVPWKEPLLLLSAFHELRKRYECSLLLAGDGPLRSEIERRIQQEHIPDVTITGFLNQSAISEAYASADIFVLPSSRDSWGLVVNEAMNFSLPVVVSDRVGCAVDLVKDNGFVFASKSQTSLLNCLEQLLSSEELRMNMGRRSLARINHWGLPETAMGVMQALGQR